MTPKETKSSASPLSGKPEIEYPCVWQYKVIGEDCTRLEEAVEEICAPVPVDLSYSHSSSKGKYHSFNAEIEVQDEEARLSIYRALHNHPAIKFVL
ncbi:MAG TPA: DUF493 domain-containing protein [Desulfopila sp.]|nr:DUF493 domain-containing protein [Desulfopila sp.]